MLQATYNDNTYTFYVTLKDAQSSTVANSLYLFKFTNDMSGAVKYGYGQNQVVNDRYAKFNIYSTAFEDEDVLTGKVNFSPNGYWKYEVYWVKGTLAACDVPNPTKNMVWECTNSVGDVIDTGDLNAENYEIKNLAAGTYTMKSYCYADLPPSANFNTANSFIINEKSCSVTAKRLLLFTKVKSSKLTSTISFTSIAPIGYEIRFSGASNYSYIVKTSPENISMTLGNDKNGYVCQVYNGATLVDTYSDFIPRANLSNLNFGDESTVITNDFYDELYCSQDVMLGSAFFTWKSKNNALSPSSDYLSSDPIEIGKLLVSEQLGEEQVQYTQNKTTESTNYIYND